MNTAEKVQNVIEIQDQLMVKEFGIEELTASNVLLMEKQILEIPEKPETKEQYDNAYRFNVDAKKILPRIEKRRKELKAPVLEKGKAIDDTAKRAVAMIQPLIELSGSRREAWEAEKAAEKAEKERQESERLAAIQAKFDMLNHLAAKPMEYNRASEDIARDLAHLEAFEISVIDFQERQGEAELIKAGAIINAESALENRKKFEADQAEIARIEAEQKAERNRLEEEQAKIEEDRKKAADAQAKVIAEENQRIAEAQAKIEADRQVLEDEKRRIAGVQLLFNSLSTQVKDRESDPKLLNQYLVHLQELDPDEDYFKERFDEFIDAKTQCINDIVEISKTHAHADHELYKADLQAEMDQAMADATARWEQTEAARKAHAERLKLVGPDKLLMRAILETYRGQLSTLRKDLPTMGTPEASAAVCDLITRSIGAADCFEQEIEGLK
jgi:hypothetical protein